MTQTWESLYSHQQPAPFPHAVYPFASLVRGMGDRARALVFIELGSRVLDYLEGR